MASPGLLPNPNCPVLKSPNAQDYVKRSNYPIPYQAVGIIESCNVRCSPTWDINVTSNSIHFKLQWDLARHENIFDLFPRAVVQIIATY